VAHSRGDNVDTKFARGAPTKFGFVKTHQNLARFVTTFDFDRKYLRNGSTYRKSEKYWINNISSPIRWKNLWTFVHKPKSYRRACRPTQLHFFGRLYCGPRGCWPLKFLHTLQPLKTYFKSDMGRRAASCWALPHISSFLNFAFSNFVIFWANKSV